ncbi:MAG: GNAT family N-acetyltransferase [Spirochaetaceae bacterium]|nr:GNAT family N-acetyltransferase [Spirochaetaceae bacterium]
MDRAVSGQSSGPGLRIDRFPGLAGTERAEVQALMAACLAADGFARLELEASLNAHRGMASAFLARDGGALLAALTIFQPLSSEAEIGALVLPAARRRCLFAALLAAAEEELARFGRPEELLVMDSRSSAGKAVAARLGAKYEYTEYSMRYSGGDPPPPPDGVVIERAGMERLDDLVKLRAEAFGGSHDDEQAFQRTVLESPDRDEYVALVDGALVGACSLGYEGAHVSINGIVVSEAARGRGIGRGLLSTALRIIRAKGLEAVLDVDSSNDTAFRLYKGMHFVVETAVEYHRRPFPA